MIKSAGSIHFIFFCYYVSRRKYSHRFFALKTSRVHTQPVKNVLWICVLNLSLCLWDQHKPDHNLHISLTIDLNQSNFKMKASDVRVCQWQVCELEAEQFTSCNFDQSVCCYLCVNQSVSCMQHQYAHYSKSANETKYKQ